MNKQTIEGNWMQLKGKVRETWGDLTDDDIDVIAGKRDQLIGKLKERYGKSTEEVDREVTDFETRNSRAD
ncbi:MAG: CsbD family protein [Gemmatimonadaceae bacterium]|nr:CsbD family protein [Gemmatimonadaceae bacterium]